MCEFDDVLAVEGGALEVRLFALGQVLDETQGHVKSFDRCATRVGNRNGKTMSGNGDTRADRIQDERVKELAAAIQGVTNRIDSLVGLLANHSASLTTLQADLDRELDDLKAEVVDIATIVKDGTDRAGPLTERVAALEGSLGRLEKSVREYATATETRRKDHRRGMWGLLAAAAPGILVLALEILKWLHGPVQIVQEATK